MKIEKVASFTAEGQLMHMDVSILSTKNPHLHEPL